jgi:hypothetical protein
MAVVRARSSPPYGLIVAIFLAVVATGAAVLFYVNWSKAVVEHDAAVADLAKVGGTDFRNAIARLGITTYTPQNSAIAQLGASVSRLNEDLAKVRRDLADKDREIGSSKRVIDQLKIQVKEVGDQAGAYQNQVRGIQDTFNRQSADALETIKKLQAAISATGAERNNAVKAGEEALNKYVNNAEQARRDLVLQLQDAQDQISKLTAEIRDLRIRISSMGGKTEVSVGEPDGRVVRVNGATGEVYINLGKKDHVTPGLPFSIYDPRTGVRFGTDASAQGNGSIEVIEVGEETSLCRITRTTKDRAIQANDLVANVVYHNDRSRRFRFTVFGDFDLDGDGAATAAERDRLITLIQSWGGQVDDDVSSQTDYLVLGEKPKSSVQEAAGALTSEPVDAAASEPATNPALSIVGSVSEVRSKDQIRYDQLKTAAEGLAIPVLNANRFLNMVGYYNTTVVRY